MTIHRAPRERTRAAWGLAAAAIPMASALLILADDLLAAGVPDVSTGVRAGFDIRVLLTEAAIVVIAAPLAGLISARRPARIGVAGSAAALVPTAWHMGRPLVACASVLVATSALSALVLGTPFDAASLSASHGVLWSAAVALGALGAFCASTFRDVLDQAASAIGAALVLGVGVFAAGPALDDMPMRLLHAVLLANPIVATAVSANVDIFRTEHLYQLSPIAHTQVTYPRPGVAILGYILAAVLLLVAAARVRRPEGDSGGEGSSA